MLSHTVRCIGLCGRYQGVVVLSMSDIPLGAPCVEQCVTRARVQSAPRRSLNSATFAWSFSFCFRLSGFGTTAKSTQEARSVDPTAILVFHQADVGEYLRDEESLS